MKNEMIQKMCMTMMSDSMKNDLKDSFKNTGKTKSCCEELEKMGKTENFLVGECMQLMQKFCFNSDIGNKSDKK